MSDIITPFLTQLLGQSPVLLLYLIGMLLALLFWGRCPSAGILVFLGSGLLLMSTVAWTIAFQYIVHSHNEWGWEAEKFGAVLSALGLANSFIHAIGLAMLLAAAFVGRGHREEVR